MKIGFLSETPLTIAFARAWSDAGHHIIGIDSEVLLTGQRAVSEYDGPDWCGTGQLSDWFSVIAEADLVLVDAEDFDVEGFGHMIMQNPVVRPGQIFCHTSPDHGREVFAVLELYGAFTMAIHPATVFAGDASDKTRLVEAMFAIDASDELLAVAQALVIELGGEAVVVRGDQRAKYSEAVGLATTFVGSIAAQAAGLLGEAGVGEKRAILAPLLRGSIEKALQDGYVPLDPEDFA